MAMRVFIAGAVLWLMSHGASATPAQCEKAMIASNASGIEQYCAYMKSSSNAVWRKGYYQMLGIAYFKKANFDAGSADPLLGRAIENASEAVAIAARGPKSASDAGIYYVRGLMYLRNKPPGEVISKDADKALKDFNVAISLKPNDASYYLSRGYAHNQLLKPDAAWADFQKAKALNPSDPAIVDAWEKQRRISPEGQAEIRKKLDQILKPAPGK